MNLRILGAAALLGIFLSGGIAVSSHAAPPADKMAAKKHTVYVCKDCKTYYTAKEAKKMSMKDSMGHKLMKMSSVPSGYMAGDKMKMGGDKAKGEMGAGTSGKM